MKTLRSLLSVIIILFAPQYLFTQSLEVEWAKGFVGLDDIYSFKTWESTTDNDNNTYVIAKFHLPDTLKIIPDDILISIENEPLMSESDIVLKFDGDGNLLWIKIFRTSHGDNRLWSIDSDANGNIYLGGVFRYTIDFDPGPDEYIVEVPPGPLAIPFHNFLIKLDSEGEFQWVIDQGLSGINSPFTGYGNSISSDAIGNVITTGSFRTEWDFDPGPDSLIFEPSGDFFNSPDALISKYSHDGDLIWAKHLSTTGSAHGGEIKTDLENNILITGFSNDTLYYPDNSGNIIPIDSGHFVLKVDGAGNYLWHHNIYGPWFYVDPYFSVYIDLDDESNSFVFGSFANNLYMDSDTIPLFTESGVDLFILKFNELGELDWNRKMGVLNDSIYDLVVANDIAINSSQEIFITALNYDTNHVNIFGSDISLTLTKSLFTTQLDQNGDVIAVKEFNWTPFDIDNHSHINFSAEGDPIISGHVTGELQIDVGVDTLDMADIYYKGFLVKLNRIPNSIDESNAMKGLTLYPNPTSETVFIDNPNNLHLQIELMDGTGRILKSRNAFSSNIAVNIEPHSSGLYFIRMSDKNSQQTFKVIKP